MKNNNEERYYFELFKKNYQDFPIGQIIDNRINKGGPDFLVYSPNKIIGIELTSTMFLKFPYN